MSIAFVTVQDVRNYIDLNADATSRYSNDTVQSNIWAASEFLEKATNRYFANRTGITLTLTTNGEAAIPLPGVRSIGTVTKGGAALASGTTFHLIPDDQQSGVYTAMSFRAFSSRGGGPWWLHSSEWFDRNLDSPLYNGFYGGSLPNDLVLTNVDVGYLDATFPYAARHAAKVLAAFYTKRPDALLSGASFGPDGTAFDLSRLPLEVTAFIAGWRIGDQLAVSL